ncbi:hypothetical protein HYU89_00640 [Candidatus Collierbacteria bacterium]|nr:hypothetical protein [Candidatus Collierbacteria bacterium]
MSLSALRIEGGGLRRTSARLRGSDLDPAEGLIGGGVPMPEVEAAAIYDELARARLNSPSGFQRRAEITRNSIQLALVLALTGCANLIIPQTGETAQPPLEKPTATLLSPPPPETTTPTLDIAPTPDLRIPLLTADRVRSYLDVPLSDVVSAIPGRPYIANVFSEKFLKEAFQSPDTPPETLRLFADLLVQINTMRAAPGVGEQCSSDSLVAWNGRFEDYFRAMPLCITPDGRSMMWLEGEGGKLSAHASVAVGVDLSTYRWVAQPLPEGVTPDQLTVVIDAGALVPAVAAGKGGGVTSAFSPEAKAWIDGSTIAAENPTATPTPEPEITVTVTTDPDGRTTFTPKPETGRIENGIRFTDPIEIAPGAFVELGTVATTAETPSLYDKHVKIGNRFTPQLWESLRRSSFPQFATNEALIVYLQGQGYIADIDIPYPLDRVDFDRPESFNVGWKTLERVDLSNVKVLIYDTSKWDQAPLFTQEDKLIESSRKQSVSLSKDPSTGGLVITIFESGLTGDKDIDSYYFAPGVISYRGYLVPRESLARLFKAMQIRYTVSGGEQYAWAAVTASGYGKYASIFNSISASSSLLLIGN